jgi:dipeptidyl aminopeptidase/acylaminoacyl peptidase
VARDPITNWVTDVMNAPDGLYRAAAWMGAMPWEDPEQYAKHSPLFFAAGFHTPTLVVAHGASPGADELFFALRARRADSALVRFPTEVRPSQTILEWVTVLGWLTR